MTVCSDWPLLSTGLRDPPTVLEAVPLKTDGKGVSSILPPYDAGRLRKKSLDPGLSSGSACQPQRAANSGVAQLRISDSRMRRRNGQWNARAYFSNIFGTEPMTNTDAEPQAHVVSLNVGGIQDIEWRGERVSSGIWKEPVNVRVALSGVNFVGDEQADRVAHGGVDKAVYAYSVEDYAYWREEGQLETSPGLFGENLTLEGMDLRDAVYGERWSIGTAELEVAQPRLPCYKLGMRLDDESFVKRFQDAKRPGVYLRIITEGDIGVGDAVTVTYKPAHGITVVNMMEALTDRRKAMALHQLYGLPEFWQRVRDGRVS